MPTTPRDLFGAAPPSVLAILLKLTSNILSSPDEPKYRTLKRSNKAISSKVLSNPGGAAWLAALGFVGDGDELATAIADPVLTAVHAALNAAVAATRVTRVCGAQGWVVHGLALEFGDGTRSGAFLENDSRRMNLMDDHGLLRRGGKVEFLQPGERIVAVRGHHSSMGYLCGGITLLLSSNRTIAFVGENANVFGAPFEFAVPPDDELSDVRFADGKCVGVVLRSEVTAVATPATPSPASGAAAAGGTGPPPRVLNSVRELQVWDPATASEPPVVRPPSAPRAPLPTRPRVLHCHDCRGGYNDCADGKYLRCFSGWDATDAFCYFGHNLVSMPPAVWVAACHARGVPCLGTLITEGGGEAADEQARLLADVDTCVDKLCALCEHFQFDGWLVNFESPLRGGRAQTAAVVDFLATLSICLRQRLGAQSLVIYYDALDADGQVRYQNALTPANRPFFDACDGIFTNYWWGAPQLQQSAAQAAAAGAAVGVGGRQHDVFCGVDLFARNTSYGAGPACAVPCRAARAAGLSLALFAPGWSVECGAAAQCDTDAEAAAADEQFWAALGVRALFRPS